MTMVEAARRIEGDELAAVQKRTVRVLVVGVIPAGAAMSGGFAAAATLGEEITGSDKWGGVVAACVSLGGALATVPLARLMARRGRRVGIRSVFFLGMIGAILGFLAAALNNYLLLVPGMLLVGAGQSGTLASRYAAADLATEETRARAIGMLLWAGVWGAALGPSLGLGPGGEVAAFFGFPELAGPYMLSAVLFLVAALYTNKMLRPDPLELSGGMTGQAVRRGSTMTAIRTISAIPNARLAVAAMVAGQAVMVGIMTATPLHMKDGSHELRIVGLVISLHIIGMYFFAPVVAKLVEVVGSKLVIAAGGGILFSGAELAAHAEAQHRMGVFVGLFLVGVGWSFGVVAASTLLTSSVSLQDRVEVQGTADLLMVGAGASAGLTAGFVIDEFGFHELSHNAGLIGVALSVYAVVALLPGRRQKASASQ